ncbi:S41 family peptidase [Aliiruegeria sabulilitoris]|uniref:S41 family peptidase n=1 Tax=Aliiruegeria sabulilitoris TaxID=1510458 RepID=UPI000834B8FB|nr:S41 family peptidase [Aliiruegeria sabulilitoris]NDR56688.1 META domain-containing protein [Pseudoruegeria sp. M32A2M]
MKFEEKMRRKKLLSYAALLAASTALAHAEPISVEGVVSSESFIFQPQYWPNPSVALLDATDIVSGRFDSFVAADDQVLGRFVDPLFAGEGRFRIDLPIVPPGGRLDMNGDGSAGLAIFTLVSAPNLSSDSYLEQLEQYGGLFSILLDQTTGAIETGALLLFSEDGAEPFPAGWGEDGTWFTEDDPQQVVPLGWSVARLNEDSEVIIELDPRSEIHTIEAEDAASPDFSDLGYVEAFDALIDHLRTRYAYSEFRGIDWDAVSSTYRPDVEAAAAAEDAGEFYLALNDMALSFEDTHTAVSAGFLNEAINSAKQEFELTRFGAGIGAEALVVSDPDAGIPPGDMIVVSRVAESSPAADAGWTEGTEILEVNGTPVSEYLASLPLIEATGVAELQPYLRAPRLFSFPDGADVSFTFRNPGDQDAQTVQMTAGDYMVPFELSEPERSSMPIDFSSVGGVAIVSWRNFSDHMLSKIAVLEEALQIESETGSTGMILDLRGNGGGLVELYQVMASYFFKEDDPMPEQPFDTYAYDTDAGGFVRQFAADRTLFAPRADLAFTGPLVILIDQGCASACEYFTQHLQLLDRAVVVGQHASLGAGGFIDRIAMPEEITFQYTAGRTTFPDSSQPNLEAAGVIPDVRVPVTLETLAAVRNGEDPVMDAAFDVIAELSDPRLRLKSTPWVWTMAATADLEEIEINAPEKYEVTFSEDGSYTMQADCNRVTGDWTLADSMLTMTPGPTTLALCPDPSRGDAFARLMTSSNAIDFNGEQLFIVVEDDEYRVLQLEGAESVR